MLRNLHSFQELDYDILHGGGVSQDPAEFEFTAKRFDGETYAVEEILYNPEQEFGPDNVPEDWERANILPEELEEINIESRTHQDGDILVLRADGIPRDRTRPEYVV